jgi:tetratricopeptide (TPR) repeat protein
MEPEDLMRRKTSRARQPAEMPAGGSSHAETEGGDELPISMPTVAADMPEPPPGASAEVTVAHWRALILSDPANSEARRRLARALEARGEAALAVEQLEAARAQAPDDIGLIVELAQAQTGLRRFDAAERELKRGLKLDPESSDVYLALGVISLRRGLYNQAEQELKRAVDLNPENGSAYYYRGEALNQLSRTDEALDVLGRAAQLQPDHARSYYLMGIVYDKKSQPQEAGAMYRKAREVGGA